MGLGGQSCPLGQPPGNPPGPPTQPAPPSHSSGGKTAQRPGTLSCLCGGCGTRLTSESKRQSVQTEGRPLPEVPTPADSWPRGHCRPARPAAPFLVTPALTLPRSPCASFPLSGPPGWGADSPPWPLQDKSGESLGAVRGWWGSCNLEAGLERGRPWGRRGGGALTRPPQVTPLETYFFRCSGLVRTLGSCL